MKVFICDAFSLNQLSHVDWSITAHACSQQDVEHVLLGAAAFGGVEFAGAIGHADMAEIVNSMLGISLPHKRMDILLSVEDMLVVAQYVGPRLPEGATVLPERATIKWWVVSIQ